MPDVRKVFINIIFFFGKRAVDLISFFLFYVVIARKLGVSEFGRFTFASTFTMLFGVLSDIGIQRFLNRECARDFEKARNKYIPQAIVTKSVLSVISMLSAAVIINLLGYSSETKLLVYLFSFSVVLGSYQTFFANILRGLQRIDLEIKATFWEKPALLISTLIILLKWPSLVVIVCVYCLLRIIILITTLLSFTRNYGAIHLSAVSTNVNKSFSLIKESIPYGVFYFFGLIYFYIDTVMLSYLKGNESVGIYQVAIKFAMFLMLIPEAIVEVVFPRLTEYFEKDRKGLEQIFSRLIKLFLFFGFAVTAISLFFNKLIIDLSFGKAFIKAASLLPIIGCMILVRFIASGLGVSLTACHQQKIRMYVIIACSGINISLNSFLIPAFDYTGAAYATLATNVFLLIAYLIMLKNKVNLSIKAGIFFKSFLAFLVMIGVSFITISLNRYISLIVSLISYILAFYFLKILNSEDVTLLKNMVLYKTANSTGNKLN